LRGTDNIGHDMSVEPIVKRGNMKRISNTDASFYYADTGRTPSVVGGLLIYDQSTHGRKKVRFKEILGWIEDRLHLWAPFRQRLVKVPFDLGLPYLAEDPNFDVEFHVHHLSLPKPGDWRQLCILASRLYSRPLDLNRPLWEINVIEGLDKVEGLPKGSFALLIKLHHIVADGASAISLLTAMHAMTDSMAPPTPPAEEAAKSSALPTDSALLMRAVPDMMQQPFKTAKSALSLIKGEMKVGKSRRESNIASAPNAPQTIFNKEVSPYRVFDACDFQLEDFKRIKRLLPVASVNDVALAVCGGAMRRYLISRDALPSQSVVAMCPINVRKASGGVESGNQISDMSVALGSDIEDPLQRLQAIKMRTDDAKKLAALRGDDILEHTVGLFSPAVASWFFRSAEGMKWISKVKPVCNTFVSNVPGVPFDLYFCGAQMQRSYAMAPLGDGMGIFHAITGIKENMSISVTACRDMVPDPAFYAECVRESFEEYLALCADEGGSDSVVYLENK